jgi:putative phage-type endonuclease
MDRQQWLEARRKHIGASEVAAILGVDPRRGPLAIYESKINGDTTEDTKWLKFGRDVEGAIAGLYEHETGRPTVDLGATTIQYHPDLPWLGATLDRLTTDEVDMPLELKHISPFSSRGYVTAEKYTEQPYIEHEVQLQIQIACTGADRGSLGAMFPGYQLAWKDIERNDQFLGAIIPVLEAFWHSVEHRRPPPPDGFPRTLDVVKRLWSENDGEPVMLDEECQIIVEQWEEAKRDCRTANARKKRFETQLRYVLKNAAYGELSDGRMISLDRIERRGYTVDAKSYTQLKINKG